MIRLIFWDKINTQNLDCCIQLPRIDWGYFQIAGCQPTRLFQTRYARFWTLKNVKNELKILNVYKL